MSDSDSGQRTSRTVFKPGAKRSVSRVAVQSARNVQSAKSLQSARSQQSVRPSNDRSQQLSQRAARKAETLPTSSPSQARLNKEVLTAIDTDTPSLSSSTDSSAVKRVPSTARNLQMKASEGAVKRLPKKVAKIPKVKMGSDSDSSGSPRSGPKAAAKSAQNDATKKDGAKAKDATKKEVTAKDSAAKTPTPSKAVPQEEAARGVAKDPIKKDVPRAPPLKAPAITSSSSDDAGPTTKTKPKPKLSSKPLAPKTPSKSSSDSSDSPKVPAASKKQLLKAKIKKAVLRKLSSKSSNSLELPPTTKKVLPKEHSSSLDPPEKSEPTIKTVKRPAPRNKIALKKAPSLSSDTSEGPMETESAKKHARKDIQVLSKRLSSDSSNTDVKQPAPGNKSYLKKSKKGAPAAGRKVIQLFQGRPGDSMKRSKSELAAFFGAKRSDDDLDKHAPKRPVLPPPPKSVKPAPPSSPPDTSSSNSPLPKLSAPQKEGDKIERKVGRKAESGQDKKAERTLDKKAERKIDSEAENETVNKVEKKARKVKQKMEKMDNRQVKKKVVRASRSDSSSLASQASLLPQTKPKVLIPESSSRSRQPKLVYKPRRPSPPSPSTSSESPVQPPPGFPPLKPLTPSSPSSSSPSSNAPETYRKAERPDVSSSVKAKLKATKAHRPPVKTTMSLDGGELLMHHMSPREASLGAIRPTPVDRSDHEMRRLLREILDNSRAVKEIKIPPPVRQTSLGEASRKFKDDIEHLATEIQSRFVKEHQEQEQHSRERFQQEKQLLEEMNRKIVSQMDAMQLYKKDVEAIVEEEARKASKVTALHEFELLQQKAQIEALEKKLNDSLSMDEAKKLALKALRKGRAMETLLRVLDRISKRIGWQPPTPLRSMQYAFRIWYEHTRKYRQLSESLAPKLASTRRIFSLLRHVHLRMLQQGWTALRLYQLVTRYLTPPDTHLNTNILMTSSVRDKKLRYLLTFPTQVPAQSRPFPLRTGTHNPLVPPLSRSGKEFLSGCVASTIPSYFHDLPSVVKTNYAGLPSS
eukprot:Blabericola_migrator_1__283@NODE_1073_length_5533_cov_66_584157_g736_i0_p1_GENE_NODE_1073_length_5533_cov_66_584157_g736_i0NODE_1073_length_5533_cov_66_584157_g736_i0_p1_ORF_typecomplete_len1031_score208_16Fes1/PF08609_10/5_7e03Fes1/PF08609_10/1_3e04Fes1/PF08609_10/8_4e03Fes1/PF08609_10/1_1e03Fes1/PF08609_10/0_013Proteasome/PF00227_26/2_6e03Proteasome/PF00227_26/0_52_NODE_1073_length_5533_cov_66_584157_g736_i08643956